MSEPLDLDAIKARMEAASPGPWHHGERCVWEVYDVVVSDGDDGTGGAIHPGDAEFIAHAREDIPALIAEVERLRGNIVAARGSLLEAEGWVDSGYEAGQLISEALGQLGTS